MLQSCVGVRVLTELLVVSVSGCRGWATAAGVLPSRSTPASSDSQSVSSDSKSMSMSSALIDSAIRGAVARAMVAFFNILWRLFSPCHMTCHMLRGHKTNAGWSYRSICSYERFARRQVGFSGSSLFLLSADQFLPRFLLTSALFLSSDQYETQSQSQVLPSL